MAARRSISMVMSFSRLILAPIRESGAEKGSFLSLIPADLIWSISSQVRGVAGHYSASLGEARMGRLPSYELEERRTGMEAVKLLSSLALSVSLLYSCETWGSVSAQFSIPTWSSTISLSQSSSLPSLAGPCHALPFHLSQQPASLSSGIHCLVSL